MGLALPLALSLSFGSGLSLPDPDWACIHAILVSAQIKNYHDEEVGTVVFLYRVGIKKPTQKNPPKKTQKNPPKKTH